MIGSTEGARGRDCRKRLSESHAAGIERAHLSHSRRAGPWNDTMIHPCRMLQPLSMVILLLGAASGGCTFVNKPLNSLDEPIGQRRLNHTHAAMLQASDPQ